MAGLLLEVDGGQIGTALEALARAGVPVRQLDVEPTPAAGAAPDRARDLWAGTVHTRPPAGCWTRSLPGGLPGEVLQSAGQLADGRTVWLVAVPGRTIAWTTSPADVEVLLVHVDEEDLLQQLGHEGLGRVLRDAAEDQNAFDQNALDQNAFDQSSFDHVHEDLDEDTRNAQLVALLETAHPFVRAEIARLRSHQ